MKALAYHGPGQKSSDEVPDPVIQDPTDAIVRVEATTICALDGAWINNITITTAHVNATTAPELLDKIVAGELDPGQSITHRFTFDQVMEAYDTFGRTADEHALKAIIVNEQ